MNARVQSWGGTDLSVVLDLAAPDAAAALAKAQELVADRLGGQPQIARVARQGAGVPRPSLWQRSRRR